MEYTVIPHTDLSVSRFCLGTMTFGGQADKDAALRITDADRPFNLKSGGFFIAVTPLEQSCVHEAA